MKYVFEINIYTDGDFSFPYVPLGMTYDGNYTYNFTKEYNCKKGNKENKENAIDDVLEICTFLKENVFSWREYKKESVCRCIDDFIENIKNNKKEHFYIEEEFSGNYDGRFVLRTKDDYIKCGFYATDEEIELFQNDEGITNEMVKEAVLDLFRNNKKE